MGKRGPKPAPPALTLLRGNPHGHKVNEGVKLAPAELVEPEDWAAHGVVDARGQAEAHATWRRIVPPLVAAGVLTAVDLDLVVDYVVCRVRITECELHIAEHGPTLWGERGVTRNPATTVMASYRQVLGRLAGELGLTPSSRGAMKGNATHAEDHRTKAARILD